MSKKPLIVVVAGQLEDLGRLAIFEEWSETFEFEILLIKSSSCDYSVFRSSLSLVFFDEIVDMPGYMRGLEPYLRKAQMILAIEVARLSTFQAVRYALRLRCPVAVICHETKPFSYDQFPNLRAIQHDVLQNAHHFLALSPRALDKLVIEGLKSERLSLISAKAESRMLVQPKLRAKFREYIKVNEQQTLILAKNPLMSSHRPLDLLLALRELHQDLGSASQIRLLFVGQGAAEKDLKYRAVEWGLVQNIQFLTQDPYAFLPDLYNAADYSIYLRRMIDDQFPAFPQSLVDGLACGLRPIVAKGSVEEDLAGDQAWSFWDEGFKSIAGILAQVNGQNLMAKPLTESTPNGRRLLKSSGLDALIWSLLTTTTDESSDYQQDQLTLGNIELALRRKDAKEAEYLIEDHLLRSPDKGRFTAELWRLKGDLSSLHQNFDEATKFYSKALEKDDLNVHSYSGLGQVALLNHSNDDALVFYKKALAIKPDHSHSLYGLGLLKKRLGQWDESLFWLGKTLELEPENLKALKALTQVGLESPYAKNAVRSLEHTREHVGDKPLLIGTLKKLYVKLGREADAEELEEGLKD